jgi:uncharacterized protein
MAAHHHTDADRNTDRRLQPRDAELRHLEVEARSELAKGGTIHHRGSVGVPIGTTLLTHINPAYLRTGLGALLVVYSIYSLVRPAFKPVQSGVPTDVGIGFFNGLLGGLTGLTGIIVTVWSQLRGWPKDVQRTVFQPVNLAAIVMSAVSLGIAGAVTAETIKLYLFGLPVLLAGLWTGLKLYGKLDDAAFRKVLLLLLLVSGLALIAPLTRGI